MSEWLTWQVVDSAFPTGLFAHSSGLESAWQHGEIEDQNALRVFLDASIQQTGRAALPLVNAAYRDPGQLPALDALADAFLVNVIANRASRSQGRTLAATVATVWPCGATIDLRARAQTVCAHVAPVSGAAFGAIGLPLPTAQKIVLYGVARVVLTAAVRLGITGSYEAQRMQHACGPWLDEVAERCSTLPVEALEQTAPIVDLLQSAHDRLYSRLFQS